MKWGVGILTSMKGSGVMGGLGPHRTLKRVMGLSTGQRRAEDLCDPTQRGRTRPPPPVRWPVEEVARGVLDLLKQPASNIHMLSQQAILLAIISRQNFRHLFSIGMFSWVPAGSRKYRPRDVDSVKVFWAGSQKW